MLKPLRDNVIVRRGAAESQSEGGIVIPDSAKKDQAFGEVLAVGPDAVDVLVGRKVYFDPEAGFTIPDVDSIEVLVLTVDEIVGMEEEG